MIPGMTGPVSMTGEFEPIPLSTISVVGSNWSEDSASVAYPVGLTIRKGDVALLFNYVTRSPSGSNPTTVIPSGLTSLLNQTGNTVEFDNPNFGKSRGIISYKILEGTETGSLTGMQHDRYEGMGLLIVRGNVRISGVTLNGSNWQGSNNNPSAQNINADTGTPPMLVFGWTARGSDATFTTNSPAFATQITSPTRFKLGYTAYASSPVDHAIDSDLGTTDFAMLCGGWFQFT